MLRNWQGSQSSVESAPRESDKWLLHQVREVHFPYPRHFIQQNERSLEQCVDLCILRGVRRRIFIAKMLDAQFEVLR